MVKSKFLAAAPFAAAFICGAAAAPKVPSPQDFANAAAQSDAYEIQAGRTAVIETQNDRVRAFAQQMIDDHTKTSDALQMAATASHLPPPPEILGGDQQKMLNALQSMKGADFDRAYVTQQVMAHTSALVTAQGYAASGTDPNLRKAAQSTVPMIQHHLETAQGLNATLADLKPPR